MRAGRTARNSPLSRFLYIYEGTAPINAIGAKTNTRAPTSFSSGDTHPHTSPVLSLCQPLAIVVSLPLQIPPAIPLVICPQRTTGPSKSTSTSSMRTAPAAHSPSPSHATSTIANAVRSHLTTITALFAFVIVYPPLLYYFAFTTNINRTSASCLSVDRR